MNIFTPVPENEVEQRYLEAYNALHEDTRATVSFEHYKALQEAIQGVMSVGDRIHFDLETRTYADNFTFPDGYQKVLEDMLGISPAMLAMPEVRRADTMGEVMMRTHV